MELNDTTGECSQGSGLVELEAEARRHRDSPEWLRWLLESIHADDRWLGEVAQRSRLHPNGFFKIVLQMEGWPRLRLHVWPHIRPRVGSSNPHGHRWPFASWIITGRLREHVFVQDERGEAFEVYRWAGADEPSTPSGSECLARIDLDPWHAGAVYTRHPGELHLAEPATAGLVATLVVQGRHEGPATPVYRRPGHSRPRSGGPMTPAMLRYLLAEVVRALRPVS